MSHLGTEYSLELDLAHPVVPAQSGYKVHILLTFVTPTLLLLLLLLMLLFLLLLLLLLLFLPLTTGAFH